jgi:hypothetical protein
MPSTAPPQPPLPSAPAWMEVGRPSPGEAQDWATWVAPLGRGVGDALYRSMVLADGAIAVTVELHAAAARRGGSGPRTVHRGRCRLPTDPQQAAERMRLLLAAADRAAAKAVQAHRGEEGATAGHKGSSSHRVPDAPWDTRRDGSLSAARRVPEEDTRERARREAARAA